MREIRSGRRLRRPWIRRAKYLTLVVAALLVAGCATVAEHRKLERRVAELQRSRGAPSDARRQLADMNAELDSLRNKVAALEGRLEVVDRNVANALDEARKARRETTAAAAAGASTSGEPANDEVAPESSEKPSAELQAYRSAHVAWRRGDHAACVDQFKNFLQTYPSSPYADDAAFWMADCHFKQGEYSIAVLRFEDVVRHYPTGNKAPDALYRQGESLMKLGYHEAARRAFERVLEEYPDSARATEAHRQLELIRAG